MILSDNQEIKACLAKRLLKKGGISELRYELENLRVMSLYCLRKVSVNGIACPKGAQSPFATALTIDSTLGSESIAVYPYPIVGP
jgi:hypothetical protein